MPESCPVAKRDYAAQFDKSDLQVFEVTPAEREAAVAALDPQTRRDTLFAIANVRRFCRDAASGRPK